MCCCVFLFVRPSNNSSHVAVPQGDTPLHMVGDKGLLDLVDPLVERGAVIDAKNNVSMGPAGGPMCRTRRCRCSYSPPSPTPSSSHSRHTHLLSMPLFQPVTRCAAFLGHFDLNPLPLPSVLSSSSALSFTLQITLCYQAH